MNDSLKGKNNKVRVMYVRKDEQEAPSRPARPSSRDRDAGNKRGDAPSRDRDASNKRGDAPSRDRDASNKRGDAPSRDRDSGYKRGDAPSRDRDSGYKRGDASSRDRDSVYKRSDAPSRDRDSDYKRGEGRSRQERDERALPPDSPWKTHYQDPDQPEVPDHGGISGKSQIDPEQLRRQRAEETRVYGENACLALFKSRPEAIVRAWFVQAVTPRFREALRWMAANRKAYHVVDDEELAKASGTEHHGGVCFLIKKRAGLDAEHYLQQAAAKDCVLAMEEVNNPHNVGAILRSCAHFGVNGVMINDSAVLESGAAVRTAEGGAEYISAIQSDNLPADLDRFRQAGYTVVGYSGRQGTPLASLEMPAKMVLVLGQEGSGLSDDLLAQGDKIVTIGGANRTGGLNVSVTAGIMLAEWWRQNH